MDNLKFNLYVGTQAAATLVLLASAALWPGPWNTQRMVGLALLMVGMVLVSTARFQLGKSFSITPQAKKLVTHGLYSKIRNPIYLFGTIAIAGVFLILQIPPLWMLLGALAVLQVLRADKEARVLEAKFGEQYRAYRRQTWF
jgi:protein-S-isoprenylcysteine O-methyltransferase Ste14